MISPWFPFACGTLLQFTVFCLLFSYSLVQVDWASGIAPRSSHILCQILSKISFLLLVDFFLSVPACMFLHSFPWRLEVLSYAYFDAILKSQYDLKFLCTPGVILQESKQGLVVNRGGCSVRSWLVAWWLNERGVSKYWESNVFLVGWLEVIWYLAVYP